MNVEMSRICISQDGKKLYSCAKYYNMLFEIDVETGDTVSICSIQGEKDLPDLFFDMLLYDKYLFLVPKNAQGFHIVDLHQKTQRMFHKSELYTGIKFDEISFFSYIWEDQVYIIYRYRPVVLCFNFKTYEWKVVNTQYQNKEYFLCTYHQYEDKIIFLSKDSNELFLYVARDNRWDTILVDRSNCNRVWFNEDIIYLFEERGSILYQYNVVGKLINQYSLSLKNESIRPHIDCDLNAVNIYASNSYEICQINCSNSYVKTKCYLNSNEKILISWIERYGEWLFGEIYDSDEKCLVYGYVLVNVITLETKRIRGLFLEGYEKIKDEAKRNYLREYATINENTEYTVTWFNESIQYNSDQRKKRKHVGKDIYQILSKEF